MSAGLKLEQQEGNIPPGWDLIAIDEVCTLGGGKTPRKSNDDYWHGSIPWVSPKDFDGVTLGETEDNLTQAGVFKNSINLYESGDIAMVVRSGVLRHSLPVAQLESDMAVNQDIKVLQPDSERIASDYLLNLLLYEADRIRASCVKTGTTVESVETAFLKAYKLPLPPLPEQRRIADILSTVDEHIQQTDEIIGEVIELKKGLRRDLVMGGILHSEYQPFKVGPFEFDIPSSWGMASVEGVAENLDSQRVPVKKKKREEMNGDIPYYGASGQIDTVDDWLFDDELLLLAEDGENLLSRNKPIAFKVSGKTWINNHAHVLKPHSDMSLEYLLNYFEILDFEPYATGTAQPKLNQKVLNSLEVPKPPKTEQDKIADILGKVSDIIEQERTNRKKLQELKRGLMQDLLTGKVRVNPEN